MAHSSYFLAKQAEKGAAKFSASTRSGATARGITSGDIAARIRKAAEECQLSERAKKRAINRAMRIAKERVDWFGNAELKYSGKPFHIIQGIANNTISYAESQELNNNGFYINPLFICGALMADIGVALVRDAKTIANPYCRAEMKERLVRKMRQLRRPFYYARETERRRMLATLRRKVRNRCTSAPPPTPAEIQYAWDNRKRSKKMMLHLGALLVNLSCFVDSCLRFDENGNVIGRNGGIRGWLKENLPDLHCKYKTLMRYKEMAEKLRQATDTHDPTPTAALFVKPHPIVAEILAAKDNTFVAIQRVIAVYIDPDKATYLPPTKKKRPKRASRAGPHHKTRCFGHGGINGP